MIVNRTNKVCALRFQFCCNAGKLKTRGQLVFSPATLALEREYFALARSKKMKRSVILFCRPKILEDIALFDPQFLQLLLPVFTKGYEQADFIWVREGVSFQQDFQFY